MNTANKLERESLIVGFNATFETAGNTGIVCRSDSWSTWFKFSDNSILCFDKLSDGSYDPHCTDWSLEIYNTITEKE